MVVVLAARGAMLGARGAKFGASGAKFGARGASRARGATGKTGFYPKKQGSGPKQGQGPKQNPKGQNTTVDRSPSDPGGPSYSNTALELGSAGIGAFPGLGPSGPGAPPGGPAQTRSYDTTGLSSASMAAAPGLGSAVLGAAGAFAQGVSQGTSPEALENARKKGTARGKNAAAAIASGLAALTSDSQLPTVTEKTGNVVKKHEKLACPCNSNVKEFKKLQEGLSEGLKKIIGHFYQVASRCKCNNYNEELARYLLKEILDKQVMSDGRPFGRSEIYKYIAAMKAQHRRAAAAGGTRKKSRYAMNKKSRTRKQQKTQSRRRTRKN